MNRRIGRHLLSLGLACLVATAFTLGLSLAWAAIGGGEMSIHGWIAMGLGVLGAVVLAWTLMALAFRSHRDGWDDRVDNSLDPGRSGGEDGLDDPY